MIFHNMRVVHGGRIQECDMEVEGGIVKRIRRQLPGKGTDIRGRYVIFNPTDMHTHMRDWDQHDKETVESGTSAAVAGGITTVVDMPNTSPPVQGQDAFRKRLRLFEEKSLSGFGINAGARTARGISSLFAKYHPPFLKLYLSETTGEYLFCGNLEKAFSCRVPIALHGELDDMRRCVSLSKKFRTPLHVCHVATRPGIEFLSKHRDRRMTVEATPHHLLLENMSDVRPPAGSRSDREALWRNLSRIDVFASDHAPHTAADKERGAFGYSGVEILLPLLLDCVRKGMLSLFDLASRISENPSRLLGRLSFGVGAEAHFAVLDTKARWTIDPSNFWSKGTNTPFDGKKIVGKVARTYLFGEEAFDGENVIAGSPQKKR